VVDLVDLHVQRERHVVAHQLEARLAEQVDHVAPAARVEVVHHEHVVTLLEQALAQVRSDEARPAGHQDPL